MKYEVEIRKIMKILNKKSFFEKKKETIITGKKLKREKQPLISKKKFLQSPEFVVSNIGSVDPLPSNYISVSDREAKTGR